MPWLGLDRRLGVEVGLLVTLSRFCVEGSCYCTGCLRCVVCVCVWTCLDLVDHIVVGTVIQEVKTSNIAREVRTLILLLF